MGLFSPISAGTQQLRRAFWGQVQLNGYRWTALGCFFFNIVFYCFVSLWFLKAKRGENTQIWVSCTERWHCTTRTHGSTWGCSRSRWVYPVPHFCTRYGRKKMGLFQLFGVVLFCFLLKEKKIYRFLLLVLV